MVIQKIMTALQVKLIASQHTMIKKVLKLLVTNYIHPALYYKHRSYMQVKYEKSEDFISDESLVNLKFQSF
jgi:hypothetical protein